MKVLLIHNKDITMEYLEDILESKCIWAEVIVALPDKFTLEVMRTIRFDMVIGSVHHSSIGVMGDFLEEVRNMEGGKEIYTYMAIEKETLGLLHQDFLHTVDDFISLPPDREEFGYRLAKAAKRMKMVQASVSSMKEEKKAVEAPNDTIRPVAAPEEKKAVAAQEENIRPVAAQEESIRPVAAPKESIRPEVTYEESINPALIEAGAPEMAEGRFSSREGNGDVEVAMMTEPSYDELLRARELRREKEKAEKERQERLKWERIEEAERKAALSCEMELVASSTLREQAVGDVLERGTVSFDAREGLEHVSSYDGGTAEAGVEDTLLTTSGEDAAYDREGFREKVSLEDIPCEPSYEDLLRERELRLQRDQEEARRQSLAKKFSAFNVDSEGDRGEGDQGQAAVLPEEHRPASKAETLQEEIDLLKHLRKDYHVRTTKVNTAKFKKERKQNSGKREKRESGPAGLLVKVSRVFLVMLLVVITTVAVFYFTGKFEGGIPVVLNLDSISHLWGMLR